MDWRGLIAGELRLTFDILFGLMIGFAILKSGFADKLMRRLVPRMQKAGIGAVLGMALTLSMGSAKAGAAYIASALDSGKIKERTAMWGTLLLSFPAYLHRWPTTMVMAVSMAGLAGAIFGTVILLRSAARFILLIFILVRSGNAEKTKLEENPQNSAQEIRFNKRLIRTLPVAWIFFAVAYLMVPWAEDTIRERMMTGTVLPLAVLTVAAASIAHVSAALALAGGSLAVGELSVAQAVFALLLGNSFGIITRLFRANAGYYFGLFRKDMAGWLLFWNLTTTSLFTLFSLVLAALPLLL
ncbi:MAG: hypothetical protein PHO18_01835 [Synergistaceae bacterium]|nr:hypothetical protein [Synergistaceae bacterium]